MSKSKEKLVHFAERFGLATPPFHLSYWKWLRLGLLVSVDALLLTACYWGAFVLRLDDFTIAEFRPVFNVTWPWVVGIHVAAFLFLGMYRQVWRYANYNSAILILKCMLFGTLVSVSAIFLLARDMSPPRSVPAIFFLLASAAIALVKFSWRAWAALQVSVFAPPKDRCLIYGAGTAGDLLARHIAADPRFPYTAVGFIDDDKNKRGRLIQGYRILGCGEDLERLAAALNVKTVILAMHAPPGKVIRGIVSKCHTVGVKPLILPDIADSLGEGVIQPRAVDIKDLLRRAPKSLDRERVRRFFGGKVVLVTGAGGSIGSEIARQIMECRPLTLVLLDSSEYNLYKIEQELREMNIPDVDIRPVLGSVVDERTVRRVFHDFHPSCVLHAAAYKHVPMVESNPLEGIVNNILGTRNVAEAAIAFRCERFLLISTDKAVRPTNIMGATKRCCEMLIQSLSSLNPDGPTFCAVRFGNVLGSSGSVVPRFMQQIQAGGPITVTHPDVTRYFMLTSEAVGLVLQTITFAKNGETFVLNMGDPVKIYDMAKELIRLAGKEPDRDIDIVFTGLRPGEKMFEELILDGSEHHVLHEDVYIATPHAVDPLETLETLTKILSLARSGDEEIAIRLLRMLAGSIDPTGLRTTVPVKESIPLH